MQSGPPTAKTAQVTTCTNGTNGANAPHGTVPWRQADHGATHIAIGDDFAIGEPLRPGPNEQRRAHSRQPQIILTRDPRARGVAWMTYDTHVYDTYIYLLVDR